MTKAKILAHLKKLIRVHEECQMQSGCGLLSDVRHLVKFAEYKAKAKTQERKETV